MITETRLPQKPRSFAQRLLYPFRRGTGPAMQEPVGFFTDTSVCIGCKACQVGCKHWNMLPGLEPRLSGRSYDNTLELSARTWRHVKFAEVIDTDIPANNRQGMHWLLASDSCKHCDDAPCMRACPTGALVRTEVGGVYPQADICNGCASCVAACPFGVIARNEKSGHSHKCTFCLDRVRDGLQPACAKTCPAASIRFGRLEDMRNAARNRLAHLRAQGVSNARLYGLEPTENYSSLHNIFLLLDRPSTYGLPETPLHPARRLKGDYIRAAAGVVLGIAILGASVIFGGVL
uniref:4Fe-4S ferredoxin iron-sulfur binding domain protein n=1 Tax=Desulfovibrio desulfuricans (strain ATCC 27774 / DSM 6949 / MB) TaxID=525146 RepID=B8IZ07_DESDA